MEDKSTEIHTDKTPFNKELDEAWKQFDQQLKGKQGEENIEMYKTFSTP